MRVRGGFGFRGRHPHASGHAEVDDPLARNLTSAQVEDDMLADTSDLFNARPFKDAGNFSGGRFQRFRLVADPDGIDLVAGDTLVQSAGYGFNFRKFGHGVLIIASA